jgi:hypothetical protein
MSFSVSYGSTDACNSVITLRMKAAWSQEEGSSPAVSRVVRCRMRQRSSWYHCQYPSPITERNRALSSTGASAARCSSAASTSLRSTPVYRWSRAWYIHARNSVR